MKKENDHIIDRIFRNRLDRYQSSVPDGLWDNIEKQIVNDEPSPAFFLFRNKFMLFMGMGLAVLFSVVFIIHGSKQYNAEDIAIVQVARTDVPSDEKTAVTEILSFQKMPTAPGDLLPPLNIESNTGNPSVKLGDTNNTFTGQVYNTTSSPASLTGGREENNTANLSSTTQNPATYITASTGNVSGTIPENPDEANISPSGIHSKILPDTIIQDSSFKFTIAEFSGVVNKEINIDPAITGIPGVDPDNFWKLKFHTPLNIQLYMGTFTPFAIYTSTDNNVSEEYKNTLERVNISRQTMYVALKTEHGLSKRLTIRPGVRYSRMSEDFSFNWSEIHQEVINDTISGHIVIPGYQPVPVEYVKTDTNIYQLARQLGSNNTFSSLNLPVSFVYRFNTGRFSMYYTSGISLTLMQNNTGHFISPSTHLPEQIKSDGTFRIQSQTGFTAGFGTEWQSSRGPGFIIEPSVTLYPGNSYVPNAPVNRRNLFLNISTGIKINAIKP